MDAKTLPPEDFRRMQLLQVDLLVEFDRVCRKNNISYCIGWGTLLGAVRHKGYIPWDDDADIGMFREDYELFKKVAMKDLNPSICWFQDHTTDPEYRRAFAKLRRTGTTYVRAGQEHLKGKTGVCIDVFPLDCMPNNPVAVSLHGAACFLMRKILWSEVGKYSAKGLERVAYIILSKIPIKFAFWIYEKLAQQSDKNSSKRVRVIGLSQNLGYNMPKKWFLNRQEYEFEGKKLFGIKDYDEFLTYQYGDYMTPPPENERKQHAPVSSYSF